MRRILPHSRAGNPRSPGVQPCIVSNNTRLHAWHGLSRAAIVDVPTAALAAACAFLILRFRVNSTWLVLGGAAAGAIIAP